MEGLRTLVVPPVGSIFRHQVLEAEAQPKVVGRKQSTLGGAASAKE